MKIAYADPPYLGCCALYQHEHGSVREDLEPTILEDLRGLCWDDLRTHRLLIDHLNYKCPDGWAVSATSVSLWQLLPLCPDDVRVSAWVKPFAVFKPNVNPAYAWEPVIWRGGRQKREREEPTVRDWVSADIALRKGLTGAKPEAFCWWLFALLGLRADDELVDVFRGTGIVGRTWERYRRQGQLFDAERRSSS